MDILTAECEIYFISDIGSSSQVRSVIVTGQVLGLGLGRCELK